MITRTSESPKRVFLLDDHELVRGGVRELINTDPGFIVVGEAGSVAEALRVAPPLNPDIALLDVRLPDGDGVTVCRELRAILPRLRCLMLTSFSDDEALGNAILAGASGYVLKEIQGGRLLASLRIVAGGGSTIDAETTARVMKRLRTSGRLNDGLRDLDQDQRRLLDLIGQNLTNDQIGNQLMLSESTIRHRVSVLLNLLGLERRAQAVGIFDNESEHRST